MYLYNSATHKKEEFKTHTPNHVEMYTCCLLYTSDAADE